MKKHFQALTRRPDRSPADKTTQELLVEIRALIESARMGVAQTVNAGLTTLYWNVGARLGREVLGGKRADYGEQIVSAVGRQLSREFGEGFSEKNLRHMMRFSEAFSNEKIVSALRRQLTWTHFKTLAYMDDPLKRDFYAEMCRIERWNTRTLDRKIGSMLFERTALSKKPAKLAALELKKLRDEDKLAPDLVFRDPYFLDFLGLKGAYQEKDVEAAILREMEAFILELGVGFTFVARQKRMQIGGNDYYLDLLFYHRKLKRLVAIELKLDKFKPEFKGQMELYLRWLEKYEQGTDEYPPIGLILCAGKSHEEVELLQLHKSGIRVAEYMTELPPRRVLEKKLHDSIRLAREQLAAQQKRVGK
jgi:predicted nuclease of restriction endonuclease-like (RecB) superfamily